MFRRATLIVLCVTSSVLAQEPDPRETQLAAEKPLFLDMEATLDERVADLLGRMTLEEKAIALNHNGPNLNRLGLRGDKWNQCLNGVQWDRPTTLFPTCIAMAATWDPDFVQREIVRAISDEARAIYNQWRRNPRVRSQHKGLIYRDPVINIGRNPYWGRNHEAFGEDPCLTGRMAVAYVRGLQGADPKYLKLASTLKHYAVNNVETDRFRLDAKVSERMLHEYWLPHFREAVVESRACSLMASYNAINGSPNNINRWLLTDLLKDQWGHEGFVVSDLGGVRTMVEGHERRRMSYLDAVAQSVMAGCDFSGREYQQYIPAAVQAGKLSMDRLDDAVARVLRVRFRLGEFDPLDASPYSKIEPTVIHSEEHRAIARRAAEKSIVLLQNRNGILPLDPSKLQRVAVIGPLADRVVLNNYNGRHVRLVSALDGLRSRMQDRVEVVHVDGSPVAVNGVGVRVDEEAGFSQGKSVKLESDEVGDFIEFTIKAPQNGRYQLTLMSKSFPSRGRFQASLDGMPLGEPFDLFARESSYGRTLALGERQLTAGSHKLRFTVAGRNEASQSYTGHFDQLILASKQPSEQTAIELEDAPRTTGQAKPGAAALQEAVQVARNADTVILVLGTDQSIEQEGRDRRSLGLPRPQQALAEAVIEANPRTIVVLKSAGPLTVPWIHDRAAALIQAWWGGGDGGTALANVLVGDVNPAGRLPHTVYASAQQVPSLEEYDISEGFTYMYVRGQPLYAFGHGLSYSEFQYRGLRGPDKLAAGDELSLEVDVTNSSNRAGDEVVQLYVKKSDSSVVRPKLQLKAFRRVSLEPGETQTVRLTTPVGKLAFYDESTHQFLVEPGDYELLVGSSSADIRLRGRVVVAAP